MRMKVVELVVDESQCETHGMIQNIADQMQVNFRQNQAVIHLHRQPIQHHQLPLRQQLQLRKQNRANQVNLQMVSNIIYGFISLIIFMKNTVFFSRFS